MQNQGLKRGSDRKLVGVCSGIAEYLGWATGRVRVVWVLGSILTGGVGGLVAYGVLAYLMPDGPDRSKFDLEAHRVQ